MHGPFLKKTDRIGFVLQGDNGGMMTLSNLTYKVSREDNDLPLTCEAFNKGTRFSSVQSEQLVVYCERLPTVFVCVFMSIRPSC